MKLPNPAEIRKVLVYAAGVLTSALATGLLPANAAHIVTAALVVLTGVGVYRVPNKPKGTP